MVHSKSDALINNANSSNRYTGMVSFGQMLNCYVTVGNKERNEGSFRYCQWIRGYQYIKTDIEHHQQWGSA